jgi:cytidine deaminase
MAALMDAARRGVSVRGCTLYSTTFPCHDCAKHIVAGGINRVVYVEPYPKSLVGDMYPDSIAVDRPDAQGLVRFEPFVGVAPSRYIELFTAERRKGTRGEIVTWDNREEKLPRVPGASLSYIAQEDAELQSVLAAMRSAGLSPENPRTTRKRS